MGVVFLGLLSVVFPRLVIAIQYFFFSSWFANCFQTWYWPLLGFFFMPHTLLWYSAVSNWYGGQWGAPQIIGLVIFIVWDLGADGMHLR